jgi:hypothetical protein
VRWTGLQPRHRIDPDITRKLHWIEAEPWKGRMVL